MQLLKHGMLPRGQVFTMMNKEMRHQAVVLFRLLYSAKTFDVFYNTAVWARFNVNEQMYLYALSVAVIHRPDTKLMKLPPMYEVMPHLYFNDEVMQKAYNIAMGDTGWLCRNFLFFIFISIYEYMIHNEQVIKRNSMNTCRVIELKFNR